MSKFEFTDPTDFMAGPFYRQEKSLDDKYRQESEQPSGITLCFKHIPSGEKCEFKAFITDYDDDFAPEWNKQEVFGRMDDIQTFKRTTRTINISWTVPSHSQEEAISNFNELAKMGTFMYPVYEDLEAGPQGGNFDSNKNLALEIDEVRRELSFIEVEDEQKRNILAGMLQQIQDKIYSSNENYSRTPVVNQQVSLLSSPPIIQMKFMNWSSDSSGEGLYGTCSNFKFKPNLEEGVFMKDDMLIPMSSECSLSFTVIHTDKLGWDRNKNKRTPSFPFHTNKLGK